MKEYTDPVWLENKYKEFGTVVAVAKFCNVKPCSVIRWLKKFNIEYKHNTAKNYRTHGCNGYIQVMCKGHPHTNKWGYILEHRLIMEQHIGRYLETNEHVHHINGIRTDNRLENLILIKSSQHPGMHKGPRKRTAEKKNKILELRNKGWLVKEIAQEVKLAEVTIRDILNKYPFICNECGAEFKHLKALGMHITQSRKRGIHRVSG